MNTVQFKEELISHVFDPNRLLRLSETYHVPFVELINLH
jgi:hypothetical protein